MDIDKVEKILQNTFIAGIEGKLRIQGAQFVISNESDIVQFTRLSGSETLLKTLGYRPSNVEDHPVKITWGRRSISPDYGLLVGKKRVAILDENLQKRDLKRMRTKYFHIVASTNVQSESFLTVKKSAFL